jgi:hypothetical protein
MVMWMINVMIKWGYHNGIIWNILSRKHRLFVLYVFRGDLAFNFNADIFFIRNVVCNG